MPLTFPFCAGPAVNSRRTAAAAAPLAAMPATGGGFFRPLRTEAVCLAQFHVTTAGGHANDEDQQRCMDSFLFCQFCTLDSPRLSRHNTRQHVRTAAAEKPKHQQAAFFRSAFLGSCRCILDHPAEKRRRPSFTPLHNLTTSRAYVLWTFKKTIS